MGTRVQHGSTAVRYGERHVRQSSKRWFKRGACQHPLPTFTGRLTCEVTWNCSSITGTTGPHLQLQPLQAGHPCQRPHAVVCHRVRGRGAQPQHAQRRELRRGQLQACETTNNMRTSSGFQSPNSTRSARPEGLLQGSATASSRPGDAPRPTAGLSYRTRRSY